MIKEIKKAFRYKSIPFGLAIICFYIFVALAANLIAPHSPIQTYEDFLKLAPSFNNYQGMTFLLGTDDLGRDLLSRLIYGTRVSLFVGICVVVIAGSIGSTLGFLAGFFEGKLDQIVMRSVDIIMAFPSILLAIVIVAIFGPGTFNAIIAVSIVALPQFIRTCRASVLQEKSKEYVAAAHQFGAPPLRVLTREIIPNCLSPLIVQASLSFSDGILNVAALGFLGLGAQPPTPEWGMMLSDARAYITSAPWMVTAPGLCILSLVLAFNLLGDGLRDYLDPKN